MKLRNIITRKEGQEEMVGFGLIIILVAVIFLVFLGVYLNKPSYIVEDYEAGSFIQSILQYTTVCEDKNGNLSIQDLITKCKNEEVCNPRGMDSCIILNNTIKELIKESWKASPNGIVKGYSFSINVSDNRGESNQMLLNVDGGVVTNNYRGSEQDFSGNTIVSFRVYG